MISSYSSNKRSSYDEPVDQIEFTSDGSILYSAETFDNVHVLKKLRVDGESELTGNVTVTGDTVFQNVTIEGDIVCANYFVDNIHFAGDVDGVGDPKVQNKAITDNLYSYIDNWVTNSIISVGTASLEGITGGSFSFVNHAPGASLIFGVTDVDGNTRSIALDQFKNLIDVNDIHASILYLSNQSKIFVSTGNLVLQPLEIGGYISFLTSTTGGTSFTSFNSNWIRTNVFNQFQSSGAFHTDRQISTCYYNFLDVMSIEAQAGRIYQAGVNSYIQNYKVGGGINFTITSDGITHPTIFSVSNPQITAYKDIILADSASIGQNATLLATDNSRNALKRTILRTKTSAPEVGSATPSFEIYDDWSSNDRGLVFLANSVNGAFNSVVKSNDAVISGRRFQNNMALTMTLWCQTACGIRMFANSATSANVSIRAGVSEIWISDSVTDPIQVNNSISMKGLTSLTRRINSISVLNFSDTLGISGYSEMYLNSTMAQMVFNISTAGIGYAFYVQSLPTFNISSSNVTILRGTPFYLQSTTGTTRLEFLSNATGMNVITGTNTSAIDSQLGISLKNASAITTEIVRFTPTSINENKPTISNTVVPSSQIHNGYVTSGGNVLTSFSSTTINTYFTEVPLPYRGTYLISYCVNVVSTDGGTFPIKIIRFGACPTGLFTSIIKTSQIRMCNLQIITGQELNVNSHFIYRVEVDNPGTVLPIVGVLFYDDLIWSKPNIEVLWSVVKLC